MPASGTVSPTANKPVQDNGVLYISASYTDKGGNNIKPLTGNTQVRLRNSKINPQRIRNFKGYKNENFEGKRHLVAPRSTGTFSIDSNDLTGIQAADLQITSQNGPEFGYTLEVYLDQPGGRKLGAVEIAPGKTGTGKQEKLYKMNLQPVADDKFHTLVFVSKPKDPKEKANIGIQWIQLLTK